MIRWRFPFVAIVLGVIACTLLAGRFLSAGAFSAGSGLLPAVLGELLTGGGLYLFLEYRVFRPAERWREKVSTAGTDPIPLEAGILSPLAAVAAGRYGRGLGAAEGGVR